MYRVKQEITGMRNEEARLSLRHRRWGASCAATNLDFILLEWHYDKLAALIEYKYHPAYGKFNIHNANIRALARLASASKIPLLVAYHFDNFSFIVQPANDIARKMMPEGEHRCSEHAWVKALYSLRGLKLPADVSARLNRSLPPVEDRALDDIA